MGEKKIHFDIRTDDRTGATYLYFPRVIVSDQHMGREDFLAEPYRRFVTHVRAPRWINNGDPIDGTDMAEGYDVWFPESHEHALAAELRAAAARDTTEQNLGNHGRGLPAESVITADGVHHPRRNPFGRKIFGLTFGTDFHFTDPHGRKVIVTHGDQFEVEVNGGCEKTTEARYAHGMKIKERIDRFGRKLTQSFSGVNPALFSYAAGSAYDAVSRRSQRVRKAAKAALEHSDCDVMIIGHTHIQGIERTRGGKLLINGGHSTWRDVECVVQDKNGLFALMKFKKDGLKITPENGRIQYLSFAELDVPELSETPPLIVDEYTEKARQLLRMAGRIWAPSQRLSALECYRSASYAEAAPARPQEPLAEKAELPFAPSPPAAEG